MELLLQNLKALVPDAGSNPKQDVKGHSIRARKKEERERTSQNPGNGNQHRGKRKKPGHHSHTFS